MWSSIWRGFLASLGRGCVTQTHLTHHFPVLVPWSTAFLSVLGRQAHLAALLLHRGCLILSLYKTETATSFSSKSFYSVSPPCSPKPHPHPVTSTSKEVLPVSLWQGTSYQWRVFHICLCLEMCVCMFVCMCVYVVCMHVSMYVMYVYMHVCMCVCICCVCVHVSVCCDLF